FNGRVSAPIGNVEGYIMVPSVFVSQSIDSMMRSPPDRRTAYGSVIVNEDGTFTYTRDPRWELLPADELDDSFAIVARGADQWAAVVVPVGGAALVRYPSILDVLNTIAATRSA
ncbi:MAG: VCBS domain-containing protein, partial [Actinomycetota bacterium]|nr:VCBS domain-containing protein [Actinomycetota bacterium]